MAGRVNFAAMKPNIAPLLFILFPAFSYSQTRAGSIPETTVTDSVHTAVVLDEVVIAARRPDVMASPDKTVYLPSATISGSGVSAYDAVTSLPGIAIDSNGSVTVSGAKGVAVNIDGRKSLLEGEALVAYLKSLPAAGVEQIEIMTAPSAKNEAGSVTATVNLKLKHERDNGFTLGVNGSGRLWKARQGFASLVGDFSNRRMSMSLTYSFTGAHNPSELFTTRPYLDSDQGLWQTYDRRRNDRVHNAAWIFDMDLTDRWRFGASINGYRFQRGEYAVMHTGNTVESTIRDTRNHTDTRQHNIFGNTWLKHEFTDRKGDIAFGIDWFGYKSDETQDMSDSGDDSLYGVMDGTATGVVASVDFTYVPGNRFSFSTGARSSFLHINNSGIYTGSTHSSETEAENNLNSDFAYREQVNALYAEGRFTRGTLSLSAGLRMEHTAVKSVFSGNEASAATDYRRCRIGLFPETTLSFAIGERSKALIGYARGITRPRYADMNPFVYIFDDITHVGGNINLREAASDSFQAAYTYGSGFRVSLSATRETGAIVKCYREITDGVLYVSPENLPDHLRATLTISGVNLSLNSWWNLSVNATLLYDRFRFGPELGIGTNQRLTPMADCRNLFHFPGGWDAELSGQWHGQTVYGQAVAGAAGSVYVGVRKSVLSSNGNITLFARDLLNTNHSRAVIWLNGRKGKLSEREYEMMRLIGISFALRFNTGMMRRTISRRNDMIDEIKRVNK